MKFGASKHIYDWVTSAYSWEWWGMPRIWPCFRHLSTKLQGFLIFSIWMLGNSLEGNPPCNSNSSLKYVQRFIQHKMTYTVDSVLLNNMESFCTLYFTFNVWLVEFLWKETASIVDTEATDCLEPLHLHTVSHVPFPLESTVTSSCVFVRLRHFT